MTIDLTNIGGARQNHPQTQQPRFSKSSAPQESLKVPQTPEAKEFRKSHWTPDKFVEDGQIVAGEVDDAQREFLKETEFIPDDQGA